MSIFFRYLISISALLLCPFEGLQVTSTSGSSNLSVALISSNSSVALKRTSTFGVMVRIFDNELPFINSFIRHYSRIGVTRFHIMCTVVEQCPNIDSYIRSTADLPQEAITLVSYGDVRWDCLTRLHRGAFNCPNNSQEIYNGITEDYLLPVDPDEFLMLPDEKMTLTDLVADYPETALFRFRWIMVPYDGTGDGPPLPYQGYAGTSKKYMVRRADVKWMSTHFAQLKCSECAETDFGPSMLHFHYRGLADSALKDSAGVYKASGSEQMMLQMQRGEPALRMKLMAFSSLVNEKFGPVLLISKRMLEIDKDIEGQVLIDHNISMSSVQEVYLRFKDALRRPENWRRFAHLAGQAPVNYEQVFNETTFADLQEYSSTHAAAEPQGLVQTLEESTQGLVQTLEGSIKDSFFGWKS